MQTFSQFEIMLAIWPDEAKELFESLNKLEGPDDTICQFRRELQRALAGRKLLNDL